MQELLPDGDERKKYINENLIVYVEDRKGHDRRYAIAPDKIKGEIGWVPDTMFEDGIVWIPILSSDISAYLNLLPK